MLELLKTLCALPGVSGDEGAARDYIRREAEKYADEVTRDVMGNLLVTKRGARRSAKKILLCAHMDEVGVIATHLTEAGFVKFACVGGIDRRVLLGKRVFFGEKRVPGVVGSRPIHLIPRDEREKLPKLEELYIDVGAPSRKDAEKLVSLGDTGAFDGGILEFGDGFLRAKAIDDRLGCAVLLKLLASDLPVDCCFAFTVQEEVGTRGAQTAAFRLEPDVALIVEATTAADLPGVADGKKVCFVGKGAVIPFMDGGAIYDRALYDTLTALATRHEIPWQTKTYLSGGTDAAAVQRSRGGVKTAALAAPVRNLHAPSCVGKISDFEAVLRLAELFLEDAGERYGTV
ncbi:MAG: M42 family metallopeptidase [Oscillospiraceae bacterium]|jgi:endoglucanase|nr:M42 family metallopeptidase [Oscillospiraceae bacterium]